MGILEGGICVLVGILLGRLWRRDSKGRGRDPQPVCGCKHHYSMHDPETGRCHGKVNGKPTTYGEWSSRPIAWEQVSCTCRRYSGPEPLPTYTAPEIIS